MNVPIFFAAQDVELLYIWEKATPEGKAIIIVLVGFSLLAWSVMGAKAIEMRRAAKLNRYFNEEFARQKTVLAIYERFHGAEGGGNDIEGCPNYAVYKAGASALEPRLKASKKPGEVSLKAMEHIKRALESAVAKEALKLESGLIFLAIAVSGAPFLGLLGTVWGVMSAFSYVAMKGNADLATMAPGVAGALITTVAGLLVAIPSMFGYNWLVHHLRVLTVELDNFAQDLVSRMETEFLKDDVVE
jgi:biopolymer transport protein ExbB/TolQ